MFKEFRAFIARGNVIDLAVAVVIGAAFGKIVTSLVDGVIMPPIGRLTGGIDFSSLFIVLDSAKGIPASLAEAKASERWLAVASADRRALGRWLAAAFAGRNLCQPWLSRLRRMLRGKRARRGARRRTGRIESCVLVARSARVHRVAMSELTSRR